MRKFFCILLAAVMLCSLSACGLNKLKGIELPPLPDTSARDEKPTATDKPLVIETPMPNTVPTITPTKNPTESSAQQPVPVREELPSTPNQVIVNFQRTSYENFDPEEGTQRILTFAYDTPIVVMEDRQSSAEAINSQISLLDETFYMGNEQQEGSFGYNGMLEMAEDNYAYVRQSGIEGLPTEYSSTRTAETARVDDRLLNLVFTYYDYTGGAHGNYAKEAYVYDLDSGRRLQLEDLTSDYAAFKDSVIYYMIGLTETDPNLYEHVYIDWIPDNDYYGTFAQLLRQGSWFFDDSGLVIFSSLYELGPYAAGIAEFGIPYSELQGKIDDKWLPAAKTESGSIRALDTAEAENGSYAFLDRVQINGDGQEFCLAASGTVYDVKLSSVYYVDRFYEKDELWFCSKMQNAALQVVASVSEGLPNLMLSYTDAAGQQHRCVVSYNGLNGGVQLADESSVQPVG